MHNVPHEHSLDIAIIPHCGNNLLIPETLDEKVIDGVRVLKIEIARKMLGRGLRNKNERRLWWQGLRARLWYVDVDGRAIGDEIKIIGLRESSL